MQGVWALIGDFNEICSLAESCDRLFSWYKASRFLQTITTCSFMNLGYQGQQFTWHCYIHEFCYLVKRLDMVIASVTWQNAFSNAYMEHLCGLHSDHNPILLRCG
ncbi:hypothetical protein NC652_003772 [Populus alba x Populus x berolinensis]|nr:hypothetical protein NC652_003772 [Populus alba x Populus x berolinensis]